MNRRELLTTAAGIGGVFALQNLLDLPAFAADFDTHDPQAAEPLTTVKLTDHLTVIMGAGGNIAALTGDEGAVQVDSGYPNRTADVAKAIADLTPQSVTMLVNTHWHFDHTGGNEAVGKAGARIIAHKGTRLRLSTPQNVEFLKMKSEPSPAIALPVVGFAETLSLYSNGEEITLTHVPPAHTDTDIFLHFHKANVIHAGDLLFNGFYPFIDYSSKGWIGGMVTAADTMLKVSSGDTKIIPGHGPMATRADLQVFREMLHAIQMRIEPMVKSGKSVEQAVAAKPTKEFDAKWGKGFLTPDQFTTLVYTGIKRHLG